VLCVLAGPPWHCGLAYVVCARAFLRSRSLKALNLAAFGASAHPRSGFSSLLFHSHCPLAVQGRGLVASWPRWWCTMGAATALGAPRRSSRRLWSLPDNGWPTAVAALPVSLSIPVGRGWPGAALVRVCLFVRHYCGVFVRTAEGLAFAFSLSVRSRGLVGSWFYFISISADVCLAWHDALRV